MTIVSQHAFEVWAQISMDAMKKKLDKCHTVDILSLFSFVLLVRLSMWLFL